MPPSSDDVSSLEHARERLYAQNAAPRPMDIPLVGADERSVPHEWGDKPPPPVVPRLGHRHVRLAGLFLAFAFAFFLVALGIAAYFFYFGGNSVSVDKIDIGIQGPTTIAGGDTVPLSLAITNRNPVAIENATLEIDFPDGTRSADNVLQPYPRYTEDLGELAPGATVMRSVKAVVFGAAGQALTMPVSLSYGTAGSNAVFVKKTSYAFAISSTPLSLSVDSLSEAVSGKPLTFALTVRSNATVPLANAVLSAAFPFGFSVASSSLPLSDSAFLLGTLPPGATKTVTLTGTLTGQDNEQRVFHFTVGTASSPSDQTIAVPYMTQDVTVTITAPFISTTLAVNGDTSGTFVLAPGSLQTVTLSYANTLATNVTNATVAVTVSGSAVDPASIQTANGFYQSATQTVVFDSDTDPSLASLPPGATGLGTFTFSTLPADALPASPSVAFAISVSGTRVGQANVPEQVNASVTKTAKVETTVVLSAAALHASGTLANTGPVPPRANQATTYTVVWSARDLGSALAGATMTATLPSYVSYTGKTSGAGSFSYDGASRSVTWNAGDFPQGGSAQGSFQVSFTPSTSQKGSAPALTGAASFSGYDRFAGTQISATAAPATTETPADPGYVSANSIVQ